MIYGFSGGPHIKLRIGPNRDDFICEMNGQPVKGVAHISIDAPPPQSGVLSVTFRIFPEILDVELLPGRSEVEVIPCESGKPL